VIIPLFGTELRLEKHIGQEEKTIVTPAAIKMERLTIPSYFVQTHRHEISSQLTKFGNMQPKRPTQLFPVHWHQNS
jgi:hypothetical protein